MEAEIQGSRLVLELGDIVEQEVEAIVNAANRELQAGGGVCGAIHRAGGPAIAEECQRIRQTQGECPTGQAVITGGGKLKAPYVIHAVGPIWSGGRRGEDQLLASAYRQSLQLARQQKIRTIAFPSLSTGIYGFPIQRAARIALRTVVDFLQQHPGDLQEVRFVLFSPADRQVYQQALAELLPQIN